MSSIFLEFVGSDRPNNATAVRMLARDAPDEEEEEEDDKEEPDDEDDDGNSDGYSE
jgi:hypothetical protein